MAISVRTTTEEGVTVLALDGTAEQGLLLNLADGIEAVAMHGGCVVVDLDALWLVEARAVRAFLRRLVRGPAGSRLAFACRRLTGREVLRRWGGDQLAVFSSVAEAAAVCARGLPVRA